MDNFKIIEIKDKLFVEVEELDNKLIEVGKPFKIHGACQMFSSEEVEMIIEEMEY